MFDNHDVEITGPMNLPIYKKGEEILKITEQLIAHISESESIRI